MTDIIEIEDITEIIPYSKFYIRTLEKKYNNFKIVFFSYDPEQPYITYLIISNKGDIIFSNIFGHKIKTRRFDYKDIELDETDKDLYYAHIKYNLKCIQKVIDERLNMKYERKQMKQHDN